MGGQTDRHDDANSTFHNFVNMLQNSENKQKGGKERK
jgi:hypothetical protein